MASRRLTAQTEPHQGPRILSVGEYGPSRPTQWHQARFIENSAKTRVDCTECGKRMWLPPSKAQSYKRCGPACGERHQFKAKTASLITQLCETCGIEFHPRPYLVAHGWGRFCSQKCNAGLAEGRARPENVAKRVASRKASRAEGKWEPLRGEDNPRWKGGEAKCRPLRNRAKIDSGRSAAYTRAWRRAHPDKVKEQNHRRGAFRAGRLPKGSVAKIRAAQKDRCAICRIGLAGGGHLDHIQPISKGGPHLPGNLQFLCAPCNVRKHAKDPLDFMRELGRLL